MDNDELQEAERLYDKYLREMELIRDGYKHHAEPRSFFLALRDFACAAIVIDQGRRCDDPKQYYSAVDALDDFCHSELNRLECEQQPPLTSPRPGIFIVDELSYFDSHQLISGAWGAAPIVRAETKPLEQSDDEAGNTAHTAKAGAVASEFADIARRIKEMGLKV